MSTQFTNRQWRLPNNENKDKQSNYSLSFDGSSDYIDVTNGEFDFSGNFTVSVWAKWNATGYPTNSTGIIDFNKQSPSNKEIFIGPGFGSNFNNVFIQWDGNGKHYTGLNAGDNQWHNIIVTGTGTNGSIKTYLDGNELTTYSSTSYGVTGGVNVIGKNTAFSGRYFKGSIDAVSIYNYVLSSSQITTLYGSSSTGIGNPMSLSPKPVAFYQLGDKSAFNNSNYLIPNSSLKDYVFDFASSNNNYIDCGNAFTETGAFSVSAWINTTATASSAVAFKNGVFQFGKDTWYNGGTGNAPYLSITDSNGLNKTFRNGVAASGTTVTAGTVIDLKDGNWHNITFTYNGTNQGKYYTDGNLTYTYDITDVSWAGTLASNSNNLLIAKTTVASWTGKLSNVKIFNTALPATGSNSVETLYNNGSPLTSMSGFTSLQGWWKLDASATYDGSNWTIEDSSSNSNDGTSSGMTQANLVQSDLSFTSGYSPYALNFDGGTEYIRILPFGTGMTLSDSWSVSIWVNTNTTLSNKGILTSRNTSTPYDFFSFGPMTKSNGKIQTYLEGIGYTELTPVINDGNWHHLTFAYDHSSTTIKVYTDNSESYSSTSYDNGTGRVLETIGAAYTSWYWIGKLSNLSVWNKQLTPSEVSEIYNEGVPSNLNNHSAYSNLVSWWQLGSNSSFNTNWTVLNEISTGSNGTSVGMIEDDIVDGVGSYANGLSSGMGGDEVIGDAPYSTANSLSVNMDVEDRVTDTPS